MKLKIARTLSLRSSAMSLSMRKQWLAPVPLRLVAMPILRRLTRCV